MFAGPEGEKSPFRHCPPNNGKNRPPPPFPRVFSRIVKSEATEETGGWSTLGRGSSHGGEWVSRPGATEGIRGHRVTLTVGEKIKSDWGRGIRIFFIVFKGRDTKSKKACTGSCVVVVCFFSVKITPYTHVCPRAD